MTDETLHMTSHRPYLMRALVEWINDNAMTPHVLVDATRQGVQVPASAVKDGRVVLNIAERAVAQLHMDNEALSFTARFGGVSFPVYIPVDAVLAVYARETGHGMALPEDVRGDETGPDDEPPSPPDAPSPEHSSQAGSGNAGKRPPFLRVVK